MECRSKYDDTQIYNYDFVDRNIVKLYKNDFSILITKSMFDKLYEIIEEEEIL